MTLYEMYVAGGSAGRSPAGEELRFLVGRKRERSALLAALAAEGFPAPEVSQRRVYVRGPGVIEKMKALDVPPTLADVVLPRHGRAYTTAEEAAAAARAHWRHTQSVYAVRFRGVVAGYVVGDGQEIGYVMRANPAATLEAVR